MDTGKRMLLKQTEVEEMHCIIWMKQKVKRKLHGVF